MVNKKITSVLFLPLILATSQSVYATLYYGACPSGTVGSPLGTGFINAGSSTCGGTTNISSQFSPSTARGARPVYDCVASGYQTTISTTQIERTAYNTINQQLMDNVVQGYGTGYRINTGSASADSNRYKPDNVWGETNITSLTEHDNKIPGVANNIYQFTAGTDKRQGDFFYGAALTYAYTDSNQTCNNDSTVHTIGITPYVSYKINDYLFASGLASYYYSNTSSSNTNKIDTHDYLGEVNINIFKVIDSFILKGRAGMRYKHTNSSLKGGFVGRDNSFDEIVGVVDGQIDYRFDNGLTLFTGALYNHYARENSGASSLTRNNDVVWMRYGAEYPVSKGFLVGAKIENDLNDTHMNYLTGSINFRLEL
jgi:hypothetical protein